MNLTRPEVTNLIKSAVAAKGGAIPFAKSLDVTPGYIHHLLAGKKPGPKVCRVIGVVENDKTWRRV